MDNTGTPPTLKKAIENALYELQCSDPKAADCILGHIRDRLANDFAPAVLKNELAEDVWNKISKRDGL